MSDKTCRDHVDEPIPILHLVCVMEFGAIVTAGTDAHASALHMCTPVCACFSTACLPRQRPATSETAMGLIHTGTFYVKQRLS